MMKRKIFILGAGLAGLTLAREILRRRDINADVRIIERQPYVGGLSASFAHDKNVFDFGSHRLHSSSPAYILEEIKSLLGDDLLKRQRNGRIFLKGRFIKFPIRLADAALHLPLKFIAGTIKDSFSGILKRKRKATESFASLVEERFGRTLCDSFYFPYARKLWGLRPDEISKEQASRRISVKNPIQILSRTISNYSQRGNSNSNYFYYPRNGFGQIADAFAEDVKKLGGILYLSTSVKGISFKDNGKSEITISAVEKDSLTDSAGDEILPADFIFSTIPINKLIQILTPQVPDEITQSAKGLKSRAMLFVYLILNVSHFTEYDAHYFPGDDVIFSRISEPKNYRGEEFPVNSTGICIEIPCSKNDEIWNAPESEIINRTINDLEHAGLNVKPVLKTAFMCRLPDIYPVYDLDFRQNLNSINKYLDGLYGIVSIGRQGLFLHNNIHNSIDAAYKAVKCIEDGFLWNSVRWEAYRKEITEDVVLD